MTARPGAHELLRNPFKIQLPDQSVYLKAALPGLGNRAVILIEDPHANYDGQKNIARTLQALRDTYGIRTVLLEGGDRRANLDGLRDVVDPGRLRVGGEELLREGILSGPEHLSLTGQGGIDYFGIENIRHYRAALLAYARVAALRSAAERDMAIVRSALTSLKSRLYPEVLTRYEALKKSESSAGTSELERIQGLFKMARETGVGLSAHPLLLELKVLTGEEARIDFDAVNREEARLLETLRSGPRAKEAESVLEGMRRASGTARVAEVERLIRRLIVLGDGKTPVLNLERYAAYLDLFKNLDWEEVASESEVLEAEVYKKLLPDPDARKVAILDLYLNLVQKSFDLTLSSREFALLKKNRSDFKSKDWTAFLDQKAAGLGIRDFRVPVDPLFDRAWPAVRAFYSLVNLRDQALVDNAVRIMEIQNQDLAVMVVGGYHTGHLQDMLSRRGLGWMILTPLVKAETDRAAYENILLAPLAARSKNTGSASNRLIPKILVTASDVYDARINDRLAEKEALSDGIRNELKHIRDQVVPEGVHLTTAAARLATAASPSEEKTAPGIQDLMLAVNLLDLGIEYEPGKPLNNRNALKKLKELLPIFHSMGIRKIYLYGLAKPSGMSTGIHQVPTRGQYFFHDKNASVTVANYATGRQQTGDLTLGDSWGSIFSVEDMRTINPILSDADAEADLREVTDLARELGISVATDMISWLSPSAVNETNYRSMFYREISDAANADFNRQPESLKNQWIENNILKRDTQGSFAVRIREDGRERVILVKHLAFFGSHSADQAIPNPLHPDTLRYYMDTIHRQIDRGIDEFRVDLGHLLLKKNIRGYYDQIRASVEARGSNMETWLAQNGLDIRQNETYDQWWARQPEPWRQIVDDANYYALEKGRSVKFYMETYDPAEQNELFNLGVDGAYMSKLFESYYRVSRGESARALEDAFKAAMYTRPRSLVYVSNFDQISLAAMQGSGQAAIMLLAIMAHLGVPAILDLRDLMGHKGHVARIVGGDSNPQDPHTHPFLAFAELLRRADFEGFKKEIENTPWKKVLEDLQRQLPGPGEKYVTQPLNNSNRDRYFSFGWKTEDDHWAVAVLDFRPQDGAKEIVTVELPESNSDTGFEAANYKAVDAAGKTCVVSKWEPWKSDSPAVVHVKFTPEESQTAYKIIALNPIRKPKTVKRPAKPVLEDALKQNYTKGRIQELIAITGETYFEPVRDDAVLLALLDDDYFVRAFTANSMANRSKKASVRISPAKILAYLRDPLSSLKTLQQKRIPGRLSFDAAHARRNKRYAILWALARLMENGPVSADADIEAYRNRVREDVRQRLAREASVWTAEREAGLKRLVDKNSEFMIGDKAVLSPLEIMRLVMLRSERIAQTLKPGERDKFYWVRLAVEQIYPDKVGDPVADVLYGRTAGARLADQSLDSARTRLAADVWNAVMNYDEERDILEQIYYEAGAQLIPGWTRVTEAMDQIPRHLFVRPEQTDLAYSDRPIPTSGGQVMPAPSRAAFILAALVLKGDERFLEIGAGSGYLASWAGQLVRSVEAVEFDPELTSFAQSNLNKLPAESRGNVRIIQGDGLEYARERPGTYDAIVVSASVNELPDPIWNALAPKGRLIIPINGELRLYQKGADEHVTVPAVLIQKDPYAPLRSSSAKRQEKARLVERLADFGITVNSENEADLSGIESSAPWAMWEIREPKDSAVIFAAEDLPSFDVPKMSEGGLPRIGRSGPNSDGVFVTLVPIHGRDIPVAVKKFNDGALSSQIGEELDTAQLRAILGVGPRIYGVIRNSNGQITHYLMELVVGTDILGLALQDRIRVGQIADPHDDFEVISERLRSVGLSAVTDYIQTSQKRLVAIDSGHPEYFGFEGEDIWKKYVQEHRPSAARLAESGAAAAGGDFETLVSRFNAELFGRRFDQAAAALIGIYLHILHEDRGDIAKMQNRLRILVSAWQERVMDTGTDGDFAEINEFLDSMTAGVTEQRARLFLAKIQSKNPDNSRRLAQSAVEGAKVIKAKARQVKGASAAVKKLLKRIRLILVKARSAAEAKNKTELSIWTEKAREAHKRAALHLARATGAISKAQEEFGRMTEALSSADPGYKDEKKRAKRAVGQSRRVLGSSRRQGMTGALKTHQGVMRAFSKIESIAAEVKKLDDDLPEPLLEFHDSGSMKRFPTEERLAEMNRRIDKNLAYVLEEVAGAKNVRTPDPALYDFLRQFKKGMTFSGEYFELTPKKLYPNGAMRMVEVGKSSLSFTTLPSAGGKWTIPVLHRIDDQNYDLEFDIKHRSNGRRYMVSRTPLIRDGVLVMSRPASGLPVSNFEMVREIISGIERGNLPGDLRVIAADGPRKRGALFKKTSVNFWPEHVKIRLRPVVRGKKLKLAIDPYQGGWAATLYLVGEGRRPDIPLESVMLKKDDQWVRTFENSRPMVGYEGLGQIPNIHRMDPKKDTAKAIWNYYWLSHQNIPVPDPDENIVLRLGYDPYIYSLNGAVTAQLGSKEFGHAPVMRRWVTFPNLPGNAAGVVYESTRMEKGRPVTARKGFVLFQHNRYLETAVPTDAAPGFLSNGARLAAPEMSFEELVRGFNEELLQKRFFDSAGTLIRMYLKLLREGKMGLKDESSEKKRFRVLQSRWSLRLEELGIVPQGNLKTVANFLDEIPMSQTTVTIRKAESLAEKTAAWQKEADGARLSAVRLREPFRWAVLFGIDQMPIWRTQTAFAAEEPAALREMIWRLIEAAEAGMTVPVRLVIGRNVFDTTGDPRIAEDLRALAERLALTAGIYLEFKDPGLSAFSREAPADSRVAVIDLKATRLKSKAAGFVSRRNPPVAAILMLAILARADDEGDLGGILQTYAAELRSLFGGDLTPQVLGAFWRVPARLKARTQIFNRFVVLSSRTVSQFLSGARMAIQQLAQSA